VRFRKRRGPKGSKIVSLATAKRRTRNGGSTACHAERPTREEVAIRGGPVLEAEATEPTGPSSLERAYRPVCRPATDADTRVLDPRRRRTTRNDGIGPILEGQRSVFYNPAHETGSA